jgi:transcription initiation factor TFIID TATA-box-binding protein
MKTQIPKMEIRNVVVAFSFEPPLDLEKIREIFTKECFFETIRDERYTFRVVALRTEKPRYTFLIYRTGKIVCTGSKNIDEAQRCDEYLLKRFLTAGINTKIKAKAEIQNIVATANLKNPIDIEKLVTDLQKDKQTRIIYEPEQFPAAIIKLPINQTTKATILLFSSGKLVCVGLKTITEIFKVSEKLIQKLHSQISPNRSV